MKKIITLFLLTAICGVVSAQSIEFNLPMFAGSPYSIAVNQGVKKDTIQADTLPADGKLLFKLPEKYQDYVGMVFLNVAQGSQNFVVNNENVVVNLTERGIEFTNSPENSFLQEQYQKQEQLMSKVDVIYRGETVYRDDANLFPVFVQEFTRLNGEYTPWQQEIKNSNLYAARYLQMFQFVNGLASRLFAPSEEAAKIADLKHYFRDELLMDDLYTSGLWNHVISTTFQLFEDKKEWGNAMVENLKRVKSQAIFNSFGNDLITICEQYNWGEPERIIIDYMVESGRVENPKGTLFYAFEMAKIKPGTKAIPIKGIKNLANSVIIFYESGCHHCEAELAELKAHYVELQKKGIRVISISSDTSEEVFKHHSSDFPWADNLCDFKGFDGDNFRHYGVVSTPTIYVIDKKGLIVDKYAKLEESNLLK
jgi:peroxiredoxin